MGGSAVALKRDAQRKPRKDDAETRHKAEIERMRAVIAEITAENLELKKMYDPPRICKNFLRGAGFFGLPKCIRPTCRALLELVAPMEIRARKAS